MNLVDSGVLIALLDRNDPNHQRCLIAAKSLSNQPLLTTWCCLTETMYFLAKIGGYNAQAKLWALALSGRLELHSLSASESAQMAQLMEQYADIPMDLADASLMVIAETRNMQQRRSIATFMSIAKQTELHCSVILRREFSIGGRGAKNKISS